MTNLDINDYLIAGQNEIFAGDVLDRIVYLRGQITAAEVERWHDDISVFDDLIAELEALQTFSEECARVTGREFKQVTIVTADSFADHLQDQAEDIYGSSAIADLGPYMDWERYTRAHAADWSQLPFGDSAIYVR